MAKQERIEENLRKNEPFVTAFDYFADMFTNGSQKDLAVLIGTKSPRISEYRIGKCPVPAEAIDGLIRFSAEKKMQIYSEYLHGNSDIMLLANVTDEELAEAELRRNNPDYDILQQRLRDSEHNLDTMLSQSLPQTSSVDASSAINAAIAAYAELINRLKQEMADRLADKDTIIAEKQSRIVTLEQTIADKDAIIRARDARILELERRIAQLNADDLSKYHFPIGAAEHSDKPNI